MFEQVVRRIEPQEKWLVAVRTHPALKRRCVRIRRDGFLRLRRILTPLNPVRLLLKILAVVEGEMSDESAKTRFRRLVPPRGHVLEELDRDTAGLPRQDDVRDCAAHLIGEPGLYLDDQVRCANPVHHALARAAILLSNDGTLNEPVVLADEAIGEIDRSNEELHTPPFCSVDETLHMAGRAV